MLRADRSKYINAFTVASLLVLPNLVWIAFDKALWKGDPAGYAILCIRHYQDIVAGNRWTFDDAKAPFLWWGGGLLVPLGKLIGSINFALLLLPFSASFISLVLLFKSFEIQFRSKAIAGCGCLVVAASPLFNSLSKQFWVDPLQMAVVAWFIYAMVKAREWDFYFALSQFIIMGSVAMLIKVSSPSYLIAPSL